MHPTQQKALTVTASASSEACVPAAGAGLMTQREWSRIRLELGPNRLSLRTLAVLAADVGLMTAAWMASRRGTLLSIALASLMQALAGVHFFLLQHEAAHNAVFCSPRHNRWLGHALGFFIALPFLPRQRTHALHHTWTGHPVRDPANDRAIESIGRLSERAVRQVEWLWRSYLPLMYFGARLRFWIEPFDEGSGRGLGPTHRRAEARAARMYLVGHALVLGALLCLGALGTTLAYGIPAFLITLVIEENANLPHHAETPLIDSPRPLPLWEQHLVSHGCRSVPVWSSLVLLNFNLHVAHHLFPWLPWHRLPEAQRRIAAVARELDDRPESEFGWGLSRRRRKLMDVMGHYFIIEAEKRGLQGRRSEGRLEGT